MKNNAKAVAMLSGGLDSTVAIRLMLDQGIAVHAINFRSPFCTCTPRSAGCAAAVTAAAQLGGIPLERVAMGDEYLGMVARPRHGYGRAMNPCIDCRIMKMRQAADFMRRIGAGFLVTGEVLGQRPMSQHRRALEIIERNAGVEGLVLRPLSAALLQPTMPELNGTVDRTKLLSVSGRSRKTQMEYAERSDIHDYPCPAGGCLLTDPNFGRRLRDYFDHAAEPALRDMPLLKVGRHRRLENGDKIVIARNEKECEQLERLASPDEHLLIPDFPGPTVLLQGRDLDAAVRAMREYTRKTPDTTATFKHVYGGESIGRCERLRRIEE